MDKESPKKFEEASKIIYKEAFQIIVAKQKDYGTRNILDFGELGVLVRSNDKMARLKNLIASGNAPNNESIEDSWKDLLNYSVIALMLRRGWFTLPLEEEVGKLSKVNTASASTEIDIGKIVFKKKEASKAI